MEKMNELKKYSVGDVLLIHRIYTICISAGQLQRLQNSCNKLTNNFGSTNSESSIQQTAFNSPGRVIQITRITRKPLTEGRMMFEQCHTMTDRRIPFSIQSSVTLSPLKSSVSLPDLRLNQAVVLDEIGEGEKVENKLVIPDEMIHSSTK
ncbi:hypothetical protein WA026_013326 [Henosepilachna vigintioctopunctata]|uniref:Uncharacterized protein n=1 Tax=Henosepilachna vigintioctopunctata TaxID=420089 RepID=A0AAW1VEJ4_9CUCU